MISATTQKGTSGYWASMLNGRKATGAALVEVGAR